MKEKNEMSAEWGHVTTDFQTIYYVHTTLDECIQPKISGEDLRAVSDYPAIYIYVSQEQDNGSKFFYIGQTNNIYERTRQHKKKLSDSTSQERFNRFRNGEYFIFYGEEISNHLNYIEKMLIMSFIKDFSVLSVVNLDDYSSIKEGSFNKERYVGKLLANKTKGNESIKYHEIRQKVEKNIVTQILSLLKDKNIIETEYKIDKITSSLFSESPFFELTDDQSRIINQILKVDSSKVHLIKGGPGTGKTVLLLHLIVTLKQEQKSRKIAVFVRHTHRTRFEKILRSYGMNPKIHDIEFVTFNKLEQNYDIYDCIIIDEGQRTTRLTQNLVYPTGSKTDTDILKRLNHITKDKITEDEYKHLEYPSFLDFIKEKFKNKKIIVAYDNSQYLRSVDNIKVEEIFDKEKEVHTLEPQLRILGSKDKKFAQLFVDFVKVLLYEDISCFDLKSFISENAKNHYLKIAEDLVEWKEYISNKQKRFPLKKSVRLAGYCKPVGKKDNQGRKPFSYGDDLYWSIDGKKFRQYEYPTLDIGNVYDIHGFDIDFAAIYIGKDIYLDEKTQKVSVNKESFYDKAAKKGVENIDDFVKNAYFILLTRAVYGQMVYIEDEKLREFVREKLKK